MYGPEVNVGVSHGRALQLLCLRLGVADVDEHGPPVFVSYVSSAVGCLSQDRSVITAQAHNMALAFAERADWPASMLCHICMRAWITVHETM
jgi:hypothetical protein